MTLFEERQRRIVTTHVGSLPRPQALSMLLLARMLKQPYDPKSFADELRAGVAAIVRKQAALNIDVVSDGEFSKTSFQNYATDRLSGLEPMAPKTGHQVSRETAAFPDFYGDGGHSGTQPQRFACTGPIRYVGQAQLATDIANFKAALAGAPHVEAFMPSVSPSSCAGLMQNHFYKNEEEHLYAVAEALREEYQAIVAAGFMLQIDDPRLAMHYTLSPNETVEQARAWAKRRVEALNHALRDIPPERVRHHTCYGINIGPRASDFELKHLADLIVTIRAGYYSFEMANPRHEHEWRVWENVKLPEGKVLLPGVITQASLLVEHPELVAERIVRLAKLVGRENVMASSDCGFASTLSATEPPEIVPEIVWAKMTSLVEGTRLATKALWG